MTLPSDDELRAMLAAATPGPWSNDLGRGPFSEDNKRANLGIWAQAKWDAAYETDPDDTEAADDAAWLCGIWGDSRSADIYNLALMTLAPTAIQAVIDMRSALRSERAAGMRDAARIAEG